MVGSWSVCVDVAACGVRPFLDLCDGWVKWPTPGSDGFSETKTFAHNRSDDGLVGVFGECETGTASEVK